MRDHIALSPLGFGCASVMGKVSKEDALRAMAKAFDLGVTHFDVARSYGFGQAEGVVGCFIKGKRDKVTVTSKFGVVPPELNLKTKVLIPVVRKISKFVPQIKARIKNKSGQLLAERNFDVAYAKLCLDKSLSELRTDFIDVYLVHEPVSGPLVNYEVLNDFMENSIRAGKIRRWGYALHAPSDYQLSGFLGGDITQFEGNASTLPSVGGVLATHMQRIVTRPFMGGIAGERLLSSLIEKQGLVEMVDSINARPAEVALCLGRALSGPTGTVLCSMFSISHVEENVNALRKYQSDPRMLEIVSALIQSSLLVEKYKTN